MQFTHLQGLLGALLHLGWGARFTLVVLFFFGNALSYAVRVDMSIAIVAMVDRSKCKNTQLMF